MSDLSSEVERLLAEVRASGADRDAPTPASLFQPPRLLDAVKADLANAPASYAVDDDVLDGWADELADFEPQGAEVWTKIALRVTRLLASPSGLDVDGEIDVLLALILSTRTVAEQGVGSAPAEVVRSAIEGSPANDILVHLARRRSEPAVAFLALLVLHLAGTDPKSTRSVATSVVLVVETPWSEPTATAAKLTVEEVRHGPWGAVPDPVTMFGLRSSDSGLAEAIERARSQVDPEGFRSFRWTVRSNEPVPEIDGPSLAAAWAVAGLELNDRARHRPRLRRVSERIAITGDVDAAGNLVSVDHLDRKAAAARADRRTGFVFPNTTDEDLSGYRASDFVPIPVGNVAEAHREARNTYDRSVFVIGLACLVVLVLLAVGAVFYRSAEEQRRNEAAAGQAKDLLLEANRLRSTDLRASLLTAYESNVLSPTAEARDLMTEGIGEGSSLRRIVATDAPAVAVETIPGFEFEDGWHAAVLDERGVITFSDLESGELLASLRPDDGEPYQAMAVNPLVPWIVTATESGVQQKTVPIYDFSAPPSLTPAACPGTERPLLAISSDGGRIAAARGPVLCVWDALSGERLAVLKPSELSTPEGTESGSSAITAVAFSGATDRVLVGRSGGFDEIDLATRVRYPFEADPGIDVISLASYSAFDGGTTVLAATSSRLHARFEDAKQVTALPAAQAQVHGIHANVDGSIVVAVYDDEVVRLDAANDFEPATGDDALNVRVPSGTVPDVAVIDRPFDAQVLASFGGPQALLFGSPVPAQQWASIDRTTDDGVAVSSDGSRIVRLGQASATGYELTPGVLNVVQSYGSNSLDLPAELDDKPLQIRDAFFTPDSEHLIVYGSSFVARDEPTVALVRVFDGRTFEVERDLLVPNGVQRQITRVLHADGDLLVVDVTGRVTVFNLGTGEIERTADLGVELPIAFDVDPAGQTLAVGWAKVDDSGQVASPPDGSISFYSYPSLEPLGAPVRAPGQAVESLEFVDDETLLTLGADDRMYELRSHEGAGGTRLWQAQEPVVLGGGQQAVDDVDVDATRERVLVVRDGDVTIYPVQRWGEPELVLGDGGDAVKAAGFLRSGDGVVVITDSSLQLWSLPSEELLDQICSVVGTGFTEEEWAEHIGDLPYVSRCPERTERSSVEVAGEVFEEPSFGEPAKEDPLPAPESTCADFAAAEPRNCVVYGDDERAFALVLTGPEESGGVPRVTQWTKVGSQWEALLQYEAYIQPEDIRQIELAGRPSQGAITGIPGRVPEVAVFDGADLIFHEFGSPRFFGSTVSLAQEVSRGEQATADHETRQVEYQWRSNGWTATAVAPGASWASAATGLLAPDGLGGIALGGPFAEAVDAVDAYFRNSADTAGSRTAIAWADGLSETATQTWTERDPMNLVEVCWYRQLCAYGDDAGKLVGWRYDAGAVRRSGGSAVISADKLGLETDDGLGLATPLDGVDLEGFGWANESLAWDGRLNRFLVGVVHSKGGVAVLPATAQMTDLPELAGADTERSQDVTLSKQRIHVTFDSSLTYRWETNNGAMRFTEWQGAGPLGIGMYGEGRDFVQAGSLPGPTESGWTLAVCEQSQGVLVSATGPAGRRSWTLSATGLVWTEPTTAC